MTAIPIWVLGEGGQARETRDLIRAIASAAGAAAGEPAFAFQSLVGAAEEAQLAAGSGAIALGFGFPGLRADVLTRFEKVGDLDRPVLVHPGADIGSGCELAPGVVVSAGCVVTTDVRLGAGTLLNPRSGVGHDSVLGRCCVVNPGANISGNVTIGDRVLVGSGATILQGLTIGSDAVVGAGAVVTRDVRPGRTVIGVPARDVTDDASGDIG
jgi:sugar O-acyltransferase (sialic acid O-acetyltransferase NeuD family)